jgi:hypothetical protein
LIGASSGRRWRLPCESARCQHVVLRYPDSFDAAVATTGSPSVALTGGYRIYTFTGSGSITF